MKPIRKILSLSLIVVSIIVFWLMPGINSAKDTTYTRYYEDTDGVLANAESPRRETPRRRNGVLAKDTLSNLTKLKKTRDAEKIKSVRGKRRYKAERIHSRDKFSKIRPSMFSRAIQFEEPLVLDEDSIHISAVETRDTVRVN